MQFVHELISKLPFDWAQFAFMHNALIAVLLISPAFALLGCLVVNNQMAFYSEAIGHAALTGIALGVIFGLHSPLSAMIGFSVALALAITYLRRRSAASSDTIISLTMAFTVALGVVLLSKGGNFTRYSRYLVGDVLSVDAADLLYLALLMSAVLLIWFLLFNRFFLVTFSHTVARSRSVAVWPAEAFFAVTVAVVVTSAIPLLGLLVINSLLILPAAASRNVAGNIPQYVSWAAFLSVLCSVTGLLVSFYWGTASGATIVLLLMFCYLVTLAARR